MKMLFELVGNHEELVLEDQRVIIMAKRTLLEKVLTILSGIAVLCCLILIGVMVASYYKSPDMIGSLTTKDESNLGAEISDSNRNYKICHTKECVMTAAGIIAIMDESVDPCKDFYKFACGRWETSRDIPEEHEDYNQFRVVNDVIDRSLISILNSPIDIADVRPLNEAKRFFKGCLNESLLETIGLKPLTEIINKFGGWPIVTPSWNQENFHWQTLVGKSRNLLDRNYLIRLFISPNFKDTTTYALYIDQTTLSMPRSVLVDIKSYKERITAWKEYMKTVADLLASSLFATLNETAVWEQIQDTLDLEIQLANISTASEERRNVDRNHVLTLNVLQLLVPNISWQYILGEIFSGTNVTIFDNTKIIVEEIEYLKSLNAILETVNPRTLANYLIWRLILDLAEESTSQMRNARFKYMKVSYGLRAQKSRTDDCISKVNSLLGMAIGRKYIQKFFSEDAIIATDDMEKDIRSSFVELLSQNTWMEDKIKPYATEKAKYMLKKIGYPEWYKNSTQLEEIYKDLKVLSETKHFDNAVTLSNFKSLVRLRDYHKPTSRSKWFTAPTYANALYWFNYNSITLLGGILQPPFFRANTLKAINYGRIGQIIGHEITHGFDDEGRQYDKFGNAVQWWSNDTIKAFKEKAQCVINQYNNYRVPEIDQYKPNATVNGIITQGENIADSGGLRQAFFAYRKFVLKNGEEPRLPGIEKYTPEQLFFIANANIWCSKSTKEGLLNQVLTDPHSPSKFRVIGPISNFEEFGRVWHCPKGSPMNPPEKCVIW